MNAAEPIAAITPPAVTHEMALARIWAGTSSTAAKRYICRLATAKPKISPPKHISGKLANQSPIPVTPAPSMPTVEPTRNPNPRPYFCISAAAGNTDSMTPRCCIVTGKVARSCMCSTPDTASAVAVNIIVFPAWPMA
jgi:hypothetical protein